MCEEGREGGQLTAWSFILLTVEVDISFFWLVISNSKAIRGSLASYHIQVNLLAKGNLFRESISNHRIFPTLSVLQKIFTSPSLIRS